MLHLGTLLFRAVCGICRFMWVNVGNVTGHVHGLEINFKVLVDHCIHEFHNCGTNYEFTNYGLKIFSKKLLLNTYRFFLMSFSPKV